MYDVIALIQGRKKHGVEVNGPDAVIGLLESDVLIDQRVGDVEKFVLEAECPAALATPVNT